MNSKKLKSLAERVNDQRTRNSGLTSLAFRIGEVLETNGFFRNCLNCIHYKNGPYNCGLVNAQIPPHVFVVGCEQHKSEDEIPF